MSYLSSFEKTDEPGKKSVIVKIFVRGGNKFVWQKKKIMALTVAKGLTKLAIGGAAVYVTVDQGVWKNSSQASLAADKVKTNVLATTNQYTHQVIDTTRTEINERLPQQWNKGVQKTFEVLADSPQYCQKTLVSTYNYVQKQLKS